MRRKRGGSNDESSLAIGHVGGVVVEAEEGDEDLEESWWWGEEGTRVVECCSCDRRYGSQVSEEESTPADSPGSVPSSGLARLENREDDGRSRRRQEECRRSRTPMPGTTASARS